jgi:hypothetical protein
MRGLNALMARSFLLVRTGPPTQVWMEMVVARKIATQFVDPGLATFSTPEFIAGWENNLSTKLGSVPIVTD